MPSTCFYTTAYFRGVHFILTAIRSVVSSCASYLRLHRDRAPAPSRARPLALNSLSTRGLRSAQLPRAPPMPNNPRYEECANESRE
eukprot:scaffold55094_cov57-Phaeocystis_antarctica.AAC.6